MPGKVSWAELFSLHQLNVSDNGGLCICLWPGDGGVKQKILAWIISVGGAADQLLTGSLGLGSRSLYPTPVSVLMKRGWLGSSLSLARS
jgi:hypothetical protein